MRLLLRPAGVFLTLAIASASGIAGEVPVADDGFRILSWNISNDAFEAEFREFQSLLLWANPDVVLLDEVSPSADTKYLLRTLDALRPHQNETWNLNVGSSGGRQRGLIASRARQEILPEFSSVIPYPPEDRRRIIEGMSPEARSNSDWNMDGGIPVNGAIILTDGQRLLVVVADLQCCGDGPDNWQEIRRRVEAREIRRLIGKILGRTQVDGIVLAGDFNMVGSTFPMAILTGPYPLPHSGLIPAELYHRDGTTTWTWDGRQTPFPSNTLDYQFYGPLGLRLISGFILDSEHLPTEMLEQLGLERSTLRRTGRHRPLIVEYDWN